MRAGARNRWVGEAVVNFSQRAVKEKVTINECLLEELEPAYHTMKSDTIRIDCVLPQRAHQRRFRTGQ